jgi:hypothetical protein
VRRYVEVAHESLCKHGEELCGDCVRVTTTPSAICIVLSDGLGSGVKANIMSTLTAQIASTMFMGGAGVEEVMETIVETLPECRERQLAYATFAMLMVSRGRDAYLVLYDSPPLILVRQGEVLDLPMTERRFAGRTVREARFELQVSDYMALISDGYEHAGVGGLYRLGWGWQNVATAVRRFVDTGGDAYTLTRALSRTCLKLYNGKPGDDATAVGMRVRPAVRATIWTGPPKDPSLDTVAVEKLMRAGGIKVICGGTTAQIAARVLGRDLKVQWVPPGKRRGNPGRGKGTPPMAHLEGVDLVTEGILTLGQAAGHLEHCETALDLPTGDDAALRLARILLSADIIRLVVGTALNPNQVADVIRGEPMRMVYVKELVRELKRRNKDVIVEQI